ncbi:conserved hypothetical protein [Vibrio owensii]|nr:conserved hypothetical protein [Vibrio owensii]
MINIYKRLVMLSCVTSTVEQGGHFSKIEQILEQLESEPEEVQLASRDLFLEILSLKSSWSSESHQYYVDVCNKLKMVLKPYYPD